MGDIVNQVEENDTPKPIYKTQEVTTPKSKIFYSPLVKSIAKEHNISIEELETISGSGKNNRVNKADILAYLDNKSIKAQPQAVTIPALPNLQSGEPISMPESQPANLEDRIEPMGRMRSKIAHHMVESLRTSPHVYSTAEVDVSNLVKLRGKYNR